jgi:hypothetical protein
MALASGAAGVTLRVIFRSGAACRGMALVTGGPSIAVGVTCSIRSGRGVPDQPADPARFHPRVHGTAPGVPGVGDPWIAHARV